MNTVTFGVIAYNEHKYLPNLLEDLIKQTYPKELTEVVLVDGDSLDDTRQIMDQFCEEHHNKYRDIKVLNNPKRVQPAGWNVVINNYDSDVLLRIDAHARLPEDFIEKNMECINSGEDVCGGPRENIIEENTGWKRTLLMAEKSMFGAGFAAYRNETDNKKYVKSLFHAAYRHEVIEKVGQFNENLIRTEDNEFHYRVRRAGYQICYDPLIHSAYQTRNNLKGMLKQKYLNGLWIGRTIFICPRCISFFHLVPFFFVVSIILTTVICIYGVTWPAATLWIAYGMADLGMTAVAIGGAEHRDYHMIWLPVLFPLFHISYGIGSLSGLVKIFRS